MLSMLIHQLIEKRIVGWRCGFFRVRHQLPQGVTRQLGAKVIPFGLMVDFIRMVRGRIMVIIFRFLKGIHHLTRDFLSRGDQPAMKED